MASETELTAAESAALDRLEADAWGAYERGDCVPAADNYLRLTLGRRRCCAVGAACLNRRGGFDRQPLHYFADTPGLPERAPQSAYESGFDDGWSGAPLRPRKWGVAYYARGHAFGVRVRAAFGGGAGHGSD